MKNFYALRVPGIALRVFFVLMVISLSSCAIPVRQAYKVDESLPIGTVQGDSFVGQRFPFKIKIPVGWQAATQYPEFLVEQGYGRASSDKKIPEKNSPVSGATQQILT